MTTTATPRFARAAAEAASARAALSAAHDALRAADAAAAEADAVLACLEAAPTAQLIPLSLAYMPLEDRVAHGVAYGVTSCAPEQDPYLLDVVAPAIAGPNAAPEVIALVLDALLAEIEDQRGPVL